MTDADPIDVWLIAGPPGAGKTTLGRRLGARLGVTSITTDDLVTAAKGLASESTHPDLFRVGRGGHVDYFTNSSVEQLQADSKASHAAQWPAVKAVIDKRATHKMPAVIDGWMLWPRRAAALPYDNVAAWVLHIDGEVLRERERSLVDFYGQSPDPEGMFVNFMSRSLWWNAVVRKQAEECGIPVLFQDGTKSPDDLCDEILNASART